MRLFRLTYKQFISALLLGGYLVSTFSLPMVEGVHFLLHLGDEVPLHSFQTHTTNHQHQFLAVLDHITDVSTDVPIEHSSNQIYKKVVQQIATNPLISFSMLTSIIADFTPPIALYASPDLLLQSPPPKA